MSRFGSSGTRGKDVRLTPFFFDCLHLDGDDLLDRPYAERVALLADRVPEERRIPRIETTDAAEAERIFARSPAKLKRFRDKGAALVGDVHPGDVEEVAGAYTPVPGGVGPLTIAMLMSNTLKAARLRRGRSATA